MLNVEKRRIKFDRPYLFSRLRIGLAKEDNAATRARLLCRHSVYITLATKKKEAATFDACYNFFKIIFFTFSVRKQSNGVNFKPRQRRKLWPQHPRSARPPWSEVHLEKEQCCTLKKT